MISAKFNIAKTSSKLYKETRDERIEQLKFSHDGYVWIKNYILGEVKANGVMEESFIKELQMSEEMIAMLPSKIDKVNQQALRLGI